MISNNADRVVECTECKTRQEMLLTMVIKLAHTWSVTVAVWHTTPQISVL